MRVIIDITEPIVLIVGSILAAILLCSLLWQSFKRIGHPEWGAVVILPAVALGLYETLSGSVFFRMTLAFTLVGAVPLWIEGRAWRRRHGHAGIAHEPRQGRDMSITRPVRSRQYPIIIACIGEARQPRHDEVRAVAARIWREGLRQTVASQNPAGSFAMRRFVFRVAKAALTGNADRDVLRKNPDNDL